MSFASQFETLMEEPTPLMRRFRKLLDPCPDRQLESMARQSQTLTRRHFGKTMRLFAPLYLSNECVNNCQYCGFSRDNPILRTTLSVPQVVAEAKHLYDLGFRNILLVAGEHPKFVSDGYLQECIDALKTLIPTIGIEVGPMEDNQYGELVDHGAEGLIVYQETYHQKTYEVLHTAGPKKKFHWRLDCPERAYAGGFRRIGIGALFGLANWRFEAIALATHLDYLLRHCWKASFTIAFPRMRPHAGNYQYTPDPELSLDDRSLVQLLTAFRMCFPQVGIVLSTREPADLRDSLFSLGVTHISAGSQTDPGGYTGAGTDDLHLTLKGRRVELEEEQTCSRATGQFEIDDKRSVDEIARILKNQGFDPVWKDWDPAILANS
ncbi:2-iminoacetate synthase ThiH [Akkermansiaceae bacterium]|nr:2-iminoacetate synthase ThiH [Akkermansiaceae bacterium]MDA7891957.1 2-iminoacetate synthase ThiH [Akkermansiaceae bacterium]MDA7930374.1 2-iminoacetate synthase ThiH [Akkermansiaceae bacterium]MDB4423585.1 2-iminoacetate synthase ThiH [bacterium]